MDISINKNDEQKNLKFQEVLEELNNVLKSAGQVEEVMKRNVNIIEYCILDIRNKDKIIALQIIEETLVKLWELTELYSNNTINMQMVTMNIKTILFNYNLGLNSIPTGKISYQGMIDSRFEIYKGCKKENIELYKLNDGDKTLKEYTELICRAEMYWEFIFTFEVLTSDNDMIAVLIPDKLRYKLVKLIHSEMNNVISGLQRCSRENALSLITVELQDKKSLRDMLVESINASYKIISEEGKNTVEDLRNRLNI